MHFKRLKNSLLILTALFLLFSCEKSGTENRKFLSFSDDTVYFDTVFSTLGSVTKELRVRNTLNSKILIDEITLSGGASSHFRLNIDGEPLVKSKNIELEGGDSIFVFVDVLIDPLNSDSPVAVTDSIIFSVSGELQKVQLLAWGQDIFLIDTKVIGTEAWNSPKPYVIFGNSLVDTSETLTIGKGTRIYFHKNASLTIAGNIEAAGTIESPVLFGCDRTEKMYEDVPGQWSGLYFLNTSKGNRISNAVIRNSVNGITIGELTTAVIPPDLKLFNSQILHSTVTALSVINGNVEAVNSTFSHCGKYCISIRAGGNYSFTHCTIFNVWDYGYRLTPSLFVSEKPAISGGMTGQLYLDVNNSVIYGDLISEIDLVPLSKSLTGNYFFDHCLIKLDTAGSGFWSRERFPGALVNKSPAFIDYALWDFRPDTLSPLINAGNPIYLVDVPADLRGASRTLDSKPDIGAYERITGEHREKK